MCHFTSTQIKPFIIYADYITTNNSSTQTKKCHIFCSSAVAKSVVQIETINTKIQPEIGLVDLMVQIKTFESFLVWQHCLLQLVVSIIWVLVVQHNFFFPYCYDLVNHINCYICSQNQQWWVQLQRFDYWHLDQLERTTDL
jgi:hypothetical protein